jgi:hypothetical protein
VAGTIDIVNRGLSKLGGMRITSLEDPAEDARLADSLYVPVRDAEISAHAWNFAKTRVMLPAEAGKPAFGWEHQYELPADCLRVLQAGPWPAAVMSGLINHDTSAYAVEGRRLLSNHGPALNLIYLRREEDTGFYPPEFVEVLACKLAVEMAESLTGSNSKRQLAWNEYEQALRLARRLNAIGRPPAAVQDDAWMTAHMMGVI